MTAGILAGCSVVGPRPATPTTPPATVRTAGGGRFRRDAAGVDRPARYSWKRGSTTPSVT